MKIIFNACVAVVACGLAVGCAAHSAPSAKASASTRAALNQTSDARQRSAILYHRTGGIAATDDRVVIWPDGLVQITVRLMADTTVRLPKSRFGHLFEIMQGWNRLGDRYVDSDVEDAYSISIEYEGKRIELTDLSSNLPIQVRQAYSEIESIAASAENAPARAAQ